ncbi:MAG: PilZ domain-containing protein [Candidatus Hydrogenedentes bacterium]|nr:PilZ domain-containing protein [Candidatus Hydrogenedentota bacterium]
MGTQPEQDRRRIVRRTADKELLQRMQQLKALADRRGEFGRKDAERVRRRTIRHTCKVGIQMEIGYAGGGSDTWTVDAVDLKGRLLDLSHEGASVFTRQPLETGQQLRLAVELRDGSAFHTKAAVRWVKAIPEKNGSASGVQFLHLTKKDQKALDAFLSELDVTAGL